MRAPLFLARRAYRLRRLTDAARLLPVIGTFLILLPVFWRGPGAALPSTATGGVYLFAVWAALILAAAIIARRLDRTEAQEDPAGRAGTSGPEADRQDGGTSV